MARVSNLKRNIDEHSQKHKNEKYGQILWAYKTIKRALSGTLSMMNPFKKKEQTVITRQDLLQRSFQRTKSVHVPNHRDLANRSIVKIERSEDGFGMKRRNTTPPVHTVRFRECPQSKIDRRASLRPARSHTEEPTGVAIAIGNVSPFVCVR